MKPQKVTFSSGNQRNKTGFPSMQTFNLLLLWGSRQNVLKSFRANRLVNSIINSAVTYEIINILDFLYCLWTYDKLRQCWKVEHVSFLPPLKYYPSNWKQSWYRFCIKMQNHINDEAFKIIYRICGIYPDIGQKVNVAYSCHWVKLEKLPTHNARIYKIQQGERGSPWWKERTGLYVPRIGLYVFLLKWTNGWQDTWILRQKFYRSFFGWYFSYFDDLHQTE